jgi:hypothetical protein
MDKWREDVYTWCNVHVVHGVSYTWCKERTRIHGSIGSGSMLEGGSREPLIEPSGYA